LSGQDKYTDLFCLDEETDLAEERLMAVCAFLVLVFDLFACALVPKHINRRAIAITKDLLFMTIRFIDFAYSDLCDFRHPRNLLLFTTYLRIKAITAVITKLT